jgi:hypothetical protein
MPQLLPSGLPERASRARFDFTEWADGQAWKFMRGEDYSSSTDSFRYNVKRWAKARGFAVETRPLPATDERGRPIPASKGEPVGLAVRFTPGPSAPAGLSGGVRATGAGTRRAEPDHQ